MSIAYGDFHLETDFRRHRVPGSRLFPYQRRGSSRRTADHNDVAIYGDLDEVSDVVDRDIAIDAAFADINLRNKIAFPLVRMLRSRKVPLVLSSGYDRSSIEPEFRDIRLPDWLFSISFCLGRSYK